VVVSAWGDVICRSEPRVFARIKGAAPFPAADSGHYSPQATGTGREHATAGTGQGRRIVREPNAAEERNARRRCETGAGRGGTSSYRMGMRGLHGSHALSMRHGAGEGDLHMSRGAHGCAMGDVEPGLRGLRRGGRRYRGGDGDEEQDGCQGEHQQHRATTTSHVKSHALAPVCSPCRMGGVTFGFVLRKAKSTDDPGHRGCRDAPRRPISPTASLAKP
jgi:hypothetical protein